MSFLDHTEGAERRQRLKFLKSISALGVTLAPLTDARSGPWGVVKQMEATGKAWPGDLITQALAAGVVEEIHGGACQLNKTGRRALQRALSGPEGHAAQHREVCFKQLPADAAKTGQNTGSAVKINLKESPLARLAVRKTKAGQPMLRPEEVRAGERLRADYTFAAMMPAIGQGWRTESRHAQRGVSGAKDFNDDVLSARQRVEQILSSLEPVLAGVLVDVCCHLKGLETIEAERGWPARCAKVVLQIGLSALAERYGERTVAAASSGRLRSWSG